MRIAIHDNRSYFHDSWVNGWLEALRDLDAEPVLLDFRHSDSLSAIAGCDGACWHFPHVPSGKGQALPILSALEDGLGLATFPNRATRWHYDNKISQAVMLRAAGFDIVPTHIFFEPEAATAFCETATYPLVFKLSTGASASGVRLVRTRAEALDLVRRMFGGGVESIYLDGRRDVLTDPLRCLHRLYAGASLALTGKIERGLFASWATIERGYVLFQDFVPNNAFDIRVTVIGDRAFSFLRHNRDGDFRASGSGKIDYAIDRVVTPEIIQTAFAISRRFGFQSMAYDFLIDPYGRPLVSEISYAYVNWAVAGCPGHHRPDGSWVSGHLAPERAHMEDFVTAIRDRDRLRS
jgi:glutathione synthase/RimK-type ligase-like ATP-grasp enzyme